MKRTDLAAPSVIDPAAFHLVAGVYFGSNQDESFSEFLSDWASEQGLNEDGKAGWYIGKAETIAEFPPLDPAGNFVRKGTCDHCGARFDWGSVYRHTGGLHIVVGNVCAEKTLSVPSRHELDVKRLKARIKARTQSIKLKALALAQAATGGYAWLYAEVQTHSTLADIAAKGLQYGGLTPRQAELVLRLKAGEPERKLREEARAIIEEAAEPVPETMERVVVRGEVLTVEDREGYMGKPVEKMLVRAEAGYKLWGSVPCSLNVHRGDKVEFSAVIQRSGRDPKFGFFSRPTKARLLSAKQN